MLTLTLLIVVLPVSVGFILRCELVIILVVSTQFTVGLPRGFGGRGSIAASRMALMPVLDFSGVNIRSVAVGTFFRLRAFVVPTRLDTRNRTGEIRRGMK